MSLKGHNNVLRLTGTKDVQRLSRTSGGRANVVLTVSPLSSVAELGSLGLEIRRRGVILVREKAGGVVIHRQMGNVGQGNSCGVEETLC
jgi:hypothetical protein